jgi:hypothetical protein
MELRRSQSRSSMVSDPESQADECSTDDGFSIDDSQDNSAMKLDRKQDSDSQRQQQQFSQKETKSVRRLKIGMIFILCISAIATGGISFWYLRRTEYSKFRTIFEDDSSKLGESVYGNVINALASLDLMSTMMVANARAAGNEFPTSSTPYFANVASKILSMSVALTLSTTMLVDGIQQRLQWEEYAWNHRTFVNESLQIMETDPAYSGEIPWNITMKPSIHDDDNPIPYNES